MRVGAADVPVRRLVRSQCVYVTVGTTRTAMKEIVLMTTLPLYSTHGSGRFGLHPCAESGFSCKDLVPAGLDWSEPGVWCPQLYLNGCTKCTVTEKTGAGSKPPAPPARVTHYSIQVIYKCHYLKENIVSKKRL